MLKIAKIIDKSVSGFIRKFKVKLYGTNDIYMEQFGCGGEDYNPPAGAKALSASIGNNPRDGVVFLYRDDIERKSLPGEKRIYSTDGAGQMRAAEIHLTQDGKIKIYASADIEIVSAGSVKIDAVSVALGNGGAAIARVGDEVTVEGKKGTITSGGNNTSV